MLCPFTTLHARAIYKHETEKQKESNKENSDASLFLHK